MKRYLKLNLMMLLALSFIACNDSNEPQADKDVMDYSKAENWLVKETNPVHEVDVFYILPTVIMQGTDSVVPFTDETKAMAEKVYAAQAKALSGFTNVYAPFYRQVPMNIAETAKDAADFAAIVARQKGHLDVFAALDYFFEHYNNGRPFILASHSQGTAINRAVLDTYMKKHPEYLKRMVAAYAIGFSLPMKWFEANPHIKPAQGETDCGVVIGYNTEGPGGHLPSMLITNDDYVINPITWTTTSEYASAEQNESSLVKQEDGTWKLVEHYADAQIDPVRRVVVCTKSTNYTVEPRFGDKSLHEGDWSLYYGSIRENAKKRIATYMAKS